MSKRVILVPRRDDNGPRDALWRHTRKYWEALDFPIYEGYDDVPLPFSRSAACNEASKLAGDWDLAILLDSDVLVNLETVKEGIEYSEKTGRIVHPFRVWKGLDGRITQKIITENYAGSWEKYVKLTYWTNISACVIVPRKVWDTVGGFDERFRGWGWEDSAFMWAADTLTGNHLRLHGDLWHLFHPPAQEKNTASKSWQSNRALAMRYQARIFSQERMLEILKEDGGPLA